MADDLEARVAALEFEVRRLREQAADLRLSLRAVTVVVGADLAARVGDDEAEIMKWCDGFMFDLERELALAVESGAADERSAARARHELQVIAGEVRRQGRLMSP